MTRLLLKTLLALLLLLSTALSATVPMQPNIEGRCVLRPNMHIQCAPTTIACQEGYVRYNSMCRRLCSTKAERRALSQCGADEMCLIRDVGNTPLAVPNVGVCVPLRPLTTCEVACVKEMLDVRDVVCWSRREGDVMKCDLYCVRYPC